MQFEMNLKNDLKRSPWESIGIVLLMMATLMYMSACKGGEDNPPRPTGNYRIPRVNLVVKSNVEGAEVRVDTQKKGITDHVNHQVKFLNLSPKTYQVTLKKEGYADRTQAVEITGKSVVQTVHIEMEPISQSAAEVEK